MLMIFEKVTLENLNLALNIQKELFPRYSAEQNYRESTKANSCYEYYIVKQNENCIGITGIYYYPEYPDSAWLGWFGIRESYRQKHYGTTVLGMFEGIAYERGFKYARLYTDKFDNDIAISFYESNSYVSEDYINEEDPASLQYPILIFSKSLTNQPLSLWNNKSIGLTEQIKKQELII